MQLLGILWTRDNFYVIFRVISILFARQGASKLASFDFSAVEGVPRVYGQLCRSVSLLWFWFVHNWRMLPFRAGGS